MLDTLSIPSHKGDGQEPLIAGPEVAALFEIGHSCRCAYPVFGAWPVDMVHFLQVFNPAIQDTNELASSYSSQAALAICGGGMTCV